MKVKLGIQGSISTGDSAFTGAALLDRSCDSPFISSLIVAMTSSAEELSIGIVPKEK